jgi:hypothetical protein
LVEAEIQAARAGEATIGARIATVDTASVTRDGALSSSLSLVSARANNASAGGYFRMLASVSGGGALAQLDGIAYTSTPDGGPTINAGFRVQIIGGQSYFDVYANTFRLIDTGGVAKTPLIYTGAKFTFTGDVEINGTLVINSTIVTEKVAANAITQLATNTSSSTATVALFLRAGSRVLIIGSWTGNPEGISIYPFYSTGNLDFYVNGDLVYAPLCGFFQDVPSGGPAFTYRAPIPTTYQLEYTAGGAGVYTFQLNNVWAGATNGTGANTISVLELTR